MGAKFRGCAKINGAKIGVSENCWCAKIKVSKVVGEIVIIIITLFSENAVLPPDSTGLLSCW